MGRGAPVGRGAPQQQPGGVGGGGGLGGGIGAGRGRGAPGPQQPQPQAPPQQQQQQQAPQQQQQQAPVLNRGACDGWLTDQNVSAVTNNQPGMISDAPLSTETRFRWFGVQIQNRNCSFSVNLHYSNPPFTNEPLGGLWIKDVAADITFEYHPHAPPQIPQVIRQNLLTRLRALSRDFHTGVIAGRHSNQPLQNSMRNSPYGLGQIGQGGGGGQQQQPQPQPQAQQQQPQPQQQQQPQPQQAQPQQAQPQPQPQQLGP